MCIYLVKIRFALPDSAFSHVGFISRLFALIKLLQVSFLAVAPWKPISTGACFPYWAVIP